MISNSSKHKIDGQLAAFLSKKISEAKKVSPWLVPVIKGVRGFVMNGGKRIRPILLCHGYLAAGGEKDREIIHASICIELIHSYLLIHDDIIDRDSMRRGKPTLHRNYQVAFSETHESEHTGMSLAIVVGDALCAWGYEVLSQSAFSQNNKAKAVHKLNTILSDVILGQEMDILCSIKSNVALKDVMKVLEYKTARYTIEGPLHLGAILAGANQKILSALSEYAIPLGIAFQIQDDILGTFGDKNITGKAVDSDIQQHKKNILIIHAQKNATSAQAKVLGTIFKNHPITEQETGKIKNVIRETKSLEFAKALACELVSQAKLAIEKSTIPKSSREFLMKFADYTIKRNV